MTDDSSRIMYMSNAFSDNYDRRASILDLYTFAQLSPLTGIVIYNLSLIRKACVEYFPPLANILTLFR